MRVYDERIADLIMEEKTGRCGAHRRVYKTERDGLEVLNVELFGNVIARCSDAGIEFSTCGWRTRTTFGLMNALFEKLVPELKVEIGCKKFSRNATDGTLYIAFPIRGQRKFFPFENHDDFTLDFLTAFVTQFTA